jgi:hypothetical protein
MMPSFIKMGLGGTGYIGKKEKYLRSQKMRISRRIVLPNFPIEEPFLSVDDVKQYLSGEKIICLLCGKSYKSLGVHLMRIHGITIDDYKLKYKIPWTYGLACGDTKEKHRAIRKQQLQDGIVKLLSHDELEEYRKNGFKHRRKEFFLKPYTINPDTKKPESSWNKRRRLQCKRGTPEFYKKMQTRATRQKILTNDLLEKINSLKKTGMNNNEIAIELGYKNASTLSTIYYLLNKEKFKRLKSGQISPNSGESEKNETSKS